MADGRTLEQMEADDAAMMERIHHSQVARQDEREYGVCAREIELIAKCLHLNARDLTYVMSVHDVQMHMPLLRGCLKKLVGEKRDG